MPQVDRCALFCVGLLLLVMCVSANAASGQEVTGSCRVVNAASLGSVVQVTLQVRLINHGRVDISPQDLTVHCRSCRLQSPQRIAAIPLPPNRTVQFTQTLTVAPQEYAAWSKGLTPPVLSFADALNGHEATHFVVLRLQQEPKQWNKVGW